MKTALFILALCVLESSCTPRAKSNLGDTVVAKPIDSSFFTKADSIFIRWPGLDTLAYSKDDFNDIVANFPELYSSDPMDPDLTYYRMTGSYQGDGPSFSSEAGQDEYYRLYAYFLQKKDTVLRLRGYRDTVGRIFASINSLFAQLNHGGTYYGHQEERITGYTEYTVYLFSRNTADYQKGYPIQAQKTRFIDLLQQQIADEISVDTELSPHEKAARKRALLDIVGKMDGLITCYFYLTKARAFLYEHYDG